MWADRDVNSLAGKLNCDGINEPLQIDFRALLMDGWKVT